MPTTTPSKPAANSPGDGDGPFRRKVGKGSGSGNGSADSASDLATVDPRADPLREYIAGGYGSSLLGGSLAVGSDGIGVRALGRSADDLTRQFGPQVYDSMMADPAVISSLNTLKQGIMAGGLQLLPAIQADPVTGEPPEGSDQERVDAALAIKEFCQRCIDRLSRPLDDVLLEMLDALAFGNKLAEVVYEVDESGEDAGLLVFKSVRPKPKDAWAFVVDPFGGVVGILAYYYGWGLGLGALPANAGAGLLGGYALLPREKFAVLSWSVRDSDPRGNSILRSAYNPWQFKVLTWPLLYQYLALFGKPKVIGITPEKGQNVPIVDNTGAVVAGKESVTPEEAMAYNLERWGTGDWMVAPNGSTFQIVSATGEGRAQSNAIDLYDRQIALAILGTTRATMEAEFGSKADSMVGQDRVGLNVRIGKSAVGHMVRSDLLKPLVTVNRQAWGITEEEASSLTPLVTMGEVEHQDLERMLAGFASVKYQTDPSQWPKIDAMLKLPVREPEPVPVMGALGGADPNAQPDGSPQVGPDGKPVPADKAGATNNQPPSKGPGGPTTPVSPPGRRKGGQESPNATTAA
jgi:hypothetical protein